MKALARAESELAKTGINSLLGDNMVKTLTINIKKGAPGGCPTNSLLPLAMNSPQSQKLAEDSMVRRYTMAAIAKANQPLIQFICLNLL